MNKLLKSRAQTIISTAALLSTLTAFAGCNANSVSTNDNVGAINQSLVTHTRGDLDNDLKADIILTGVTGWTTLPVAHGAVSGSTLSFNVTNQAVANQAGIDFTLLSALPGVKTLSGDFNGDFQNDLILLGGNLTTMPIAFGNPGGAFTSSFKPQVLFQTWASGANVKAITGDFDCDGKSDVALFGAGLTTVPVAYSDSSTADFTVLNLPLTSFTGWAASPGATPVSGDFNHDGCSDVALIGGSGFTTIPILLGAPYRGTFTIQNVAPDANAQTFQGWSTMSGAVALSGDFDNDGYSDIALVGSPSFTTIPVALSNGNGTFTLANGPLTSFTGWAASANTRAVAGDFDGDGLSDIALLGSSALTTVPIAKGSSSTRGTFTFVNPPLASFQALAALPGAEPISTPKAE